jgi:hypothetical protein
MRVMACSLRRTSLGRAVCASGVVLCSFLLGACGQSTIKPSGAEQAVAEVVSKQTGFHPNDVKCPSGVEAKVGRAFKCHFTGPEGKDYTASVRINQIQGQRVLFYVSTRPTS